MPLFNRRKNRHIVQDRILLERVSNQVNAILDAQMHLRDDMQRQFGELSTPYRRSKKLAWALVAAALLGVIAAVIGGTRATAIQDQSTTMQETALQDSLQATQYLEPLLQISAEKGARYLVDHANQMTVTDMQSVLDSIEASKRDVAAADQMNRVASQGQVLSQVSLAFSSALLGAVLGWILMATFAEPRIKSGGQELV